MSKYIIPFLIMLAIVVAAVKRVNVYDSFISGTRSAIKLAIDVAPYIISILIVIELFTASGFDRILERILEPVFRVIGIPRELTSLLIIRPLSGSGSIAVLENILTTYGADSYIGRCASIIVGASETIFYVSVVYFSTSKVEKLGLTIPIALFASLIGVIVACLLARIM